MTNLSTLVIYGALYVSFTFQGLFLIGVLGYNEQAAGIAGIPSSLLLVLFSTRFGRLAARHGPRLFMTAGPAIMALGLLWFVRIPSTSEGWVFGQAGGSILPPGDYFIDILPALLVFGAGPHDHGGAADHGADDVGAREQGGRGLGDQQRDLAGGLAAGDRGDLRGGGGELLQLDRQAGARGEHGLGAVPRTGGAAERAVGGRVARDR